MILPDSALIQCPYCGESIEIELDLSAQKQEYVEDCQVCCQPILIKITPDDMNNTVVNVRKENE